MQFETQKKSNKGKAEILPKKDVRIVFDFTLNAFFEHLLNIIQCCLLPLQYLDVCKASNGAPGGSSTACDPSNLINEPAAVEASSKSVSGVNGSSPLENTELSATKHDDLVLKFPLHFLVS